MVNKIRTSEYRNLYNPENVFISEDGGGAGNNWGSGYTQAEKVHEVRLDMSLSSLSLSSIHWVHYSLIDVYVCKGSDGDD